MKRILISITAFSLMAFLISLLVFVVDTVELKWAITAGALGALGIGLAFNSYLLALRTDTRMNEIQVTISQIIGLQDKLQEEQSEQKSSGSQIIPTLEVFSQFYMDYLNKQKGEDKK
ncbi:hypothetical protein ACFLWR_04785 [Chloroflexota bacterium]